MALTKQDLQAIGKVMDERLLSFSEKVTEPALDNLAEDLRGEIRDLDDKLSAKIDNLDRKVMRITDNHSIKLDKLNKAVFA